MTTINDISDLVQVLQDRPDWLAAVRNLVLGEELLALPRQLARFAESTEANFRLVQEQFRLMHERQDRLEGRTGNFEGYIYEHRVSTRILLRLIQVFGMNSPTIVMPQEGLAAPEINRLINRGPQSGAVRQDEIADLLETDIIIADQDGGYAVIEVSVTADYDDIERAERRARVMSLASGLPAKAVVATAHLHGPRQSLADNRGVTALVFPNR